ncbi:SDR family oxidoreductase [Allokutzneria sp. A3M-2-11 16]|uniref:type I polyketide synthase n=1 Tax=Allokutzneria sp. A3M-2-11 16 TaxID=2962043 RepID=UPI0020B8AA9C|nr:type I polyketide synthase [Allokutzneria sp. A3M-2-11 16]MCP3802576.1 SDR family oxidoreductase [Allokutzneria sp. A3M-2-11 16]
MARESAQPPVAIVGLGTIMPGSLDAEGFWRTVVEGRDLITDVPGTHWLVEDHYDADPSAPGKTYARRGAFLPEVDFDPVAFGIPPNVLPATDSTQLLSLVVAEQVLADLGGGLGETDRDRVSVILGASAMKLMSEMTGWLNRPVWLKALRENGVDEPTAQAVCDGIAGHGVDWQEATFPGMLGNVVAGRIANRFDLHGANYTTDAACGSSLAAVSAAIAELAIGRADLVLTGGVDTTNDIGTFVSFSKTPALSPSGDCRPFAEDADGTMLGEGLAMLALKRLDDAERDGDRIYAVIRGIGAASDGRSTAIYAPLPEGQARALRRAYDVAGYDPGTVELVEAHGTGTIAGDRAEFGSLREVFDESGRTDRQWCALGSVKSQVGHTKCAAGAAGLVKAALALHHKVLPPTIKVDRPNPELELERTPFYLNTQARPWVGNPAHPRRAALSSFGFGGSNFHLTLEEYTGPAAAWRHRSQPSELVLFSASSSQELLKSLRAKRSGSLADIARRSQLRFRATDAVRLAVVATDIGDLERAAALVEKSPDKGFSTPNGVHYGLSIVEGRTAFLFPGQGSQYVGMSADITMHVPSAQRVWDRIGDFDEQPLHQVVFPRPAFTDAERAEQTARITATEWAQPALAAHSLALLGVLYSLGLRPGCVAGHSFGELVALYAAGAVDERSLLRMARRRGELMRDAAEVPGVMTAVTASREDVENVLSGIGIADVWVANHNAPDQVVISVGAPSADVVEQKIAAEGVAVKRLNTATAFHSPLVADASAPFLDFLSGIPVVEPGVEVFGNADAAVYPSAPEEIRSRVAGHLAAPVRFVEQIEALYAAGVRRFVEVGAGSTLTGLVGRILGDREHLAVGTDRKGRNGISSLNEALARLAVSGTELGYEALWERNAPLAEPKKESKAKMTVRINGANQGRQYPPAGGATAFPAPNPVVPAAEPVVAQEASAPGWLRAVEESQRQTAEAHNTYQQLLSESHLAFLRSSEATLAALLGSPGELSAAPAPAPVPAPVSLPAAAVVSAPAMPSAPMMPAAPVMPSITAMPAPPVSASVPVGPATDVSAVLLSVVADRTGYPVEMLDLDMELEADLGIDSIKRVEVFSALRREVPGLAELDSARLGALRTLREISSGLGGGVSSSSTAGQDISGVLLNVVADRTGYPVEMLDLDMELEADLGIDSIKRVEVFSALRKEVPGLAELDSARLGALRTLRQITSEFGGAVEAGSTGSAGNTVVRRVTRAVGTPAPGLAMVGLGDFPLYVTEDGGGIADCVAAKLTARGIAAKVVTEVPADANGVVHLGGLAEIRSIDDALTIHRDAYQTAWRTAATFTTEGGVFVTVQDTGGDFGLDGRSPNRAWLGGISALSRVVAKEWDYASVRAIDCERGGRTPDEIAEAIVGELLSGGSTLDVGLRADGTRLTLRAVAQELDGTPGTAVGPESVIVVGGGARGVTAPGLLALARSHRPRLVILGRSPLADEPDYLAGITDESALVQAVARHERAAPGVVRSRVRGVLANREVHANLKALRDAGSEVSYHAVDIRDSAEVAVALATVREQWGPITGLVHAAGVIEDHPLVEKTDEQYELVTSTKLTGLRALLDATAEDPLTMLCLFSSVAGTFGSDRQSDYAMANETLNHVAVAESVRRPDCLVRSIAWGPWEGGMVDSSLKEFFRRREIALIPLAEGGAAFTDEVTGAGNDVRVIITAGEGVAVMTGRNQDPPSVEVRLHASTHPDLVGHADTGVTATTAVDWMSRAARTWFPELDSVVLDDVQQLGTLPLPGLTGSGSRIPVRGKRIDASVVDIEVGDAPSFRARLQIQ